MKRQLTLLALAIGFITNAQISTFGTNSSGTYASAMGHNTTASGFASTATGDQTTASGGGSTAMGGLTIASGNGSTAMGVGTTASDFASTVIGQYNSSGSTATSSAESFSTAAPAFVIGNGTASDARSDAFKVFFNGDTTAAGSVTATSFIGDGSQLTNLPSASIAFADLTSTPTTLGGYGIIDAGTGILAPVTENGNTGVRLSTSDAANHGDIGSNAVDLSTQLYASTTHGATGNYSIAMGFTTTASGEISTSIGNGATASERSSTAIGTYSTASGEHSLAMGGGTAIGGNSTAIGTYSTAKGEYSIAMGYYSKAEGYYSTAIGRDTAAMGYYSTAIGYETKSIGDYSSAMGYGTISQGYASTTLGVGTISNNFASVIIGHYNTSPTYSGPGESGNAFSTANAAFVIGNGTDSSNRSDAFKVKFSGDTTVSNDLTVNGDVVISSDARLKANIISLGATLSKLLLIDGKSYTMKKDGEQKIGVLAQDIQKVFPELVSTDDNDMLTVNYQGLVPVLINALKEQDKKFKEQEKRLERLEKLVAQLD